MSLFHLVALSSLLQMAVDVKGLVLLVLMVNVCLNMLLVLSTADPGTTHVLVVPMCVANAQAMRQ